MIGSLNRFGPWPSATADYPKEIWVQEARGPGTGISSRSEAVAAAREIEMPFPAYEMTRNSGCLRFWDEPEEDLYTFDDGEEVGG